MRLRLNTDGVAIPLYAQLREQIQHLIETGELIPGTQLPPASRLADNLQINRNTVLSAYRELAQAGYVEFRKGVGTFVAHDVAPLRSNVEEGALMEQFDGAIRFALGAGLAPERIASLAFMRAQTIQSESGSADTGKRITIGFFECNSQSLDYYASELRPAVDGDLRTYLLGSLNDGTVPPGLLECDLLVTTFFHLAELRRKVKENRAFRKLEVFAIAVRPHLEVLRQLNDLPDGTALGILYFEEPEFTRARLQQMVDHIRHANLSNLSRIEPIYVRGELRAEDVSNVDAVLFRPENHALTGHLPGLGIRVIEYRNVLDRASVALLNEVVHDIQFARADVQGGSAGWRPRKSLIHAR